MSKRTRPRFYMMRKLRRKARQRGGFAITHFSITDSTGKTVHLGRGTMTLRKMLVYGA